VGVATFLTLGTGQDHDGDHDQDDPQDPAPGHLHTALLVVVDVRRRHRDSIATSDWSGQGGAGRRSNPMQEASKPGPTRTYETSELGARRSSSHVLNDKHRRLVGVVVPNADDLKGPTAPQRDRVARTPRKNGGLERRGVGGRPVEAFELERVRHPSLLTPHRGTHAVRISVTGVTLVPLNHAVFA
jgi:hypothetical protein